MLPKGFRAAMLTIPDENDFLCVVRPFHLWTWLAILATFLLFATALTIVSTIYQKWNHAGEKRFTFAQSLWYFWSSWLQLEFNDADGDADDAAAPLPISPSGKILMSAWGLFVIIVLAMYTANLAAQFSLRSEMRPLKSVIDLETAKHVQLFTYERFKLWIERENLFAHIRRHERLRFLSEHNDGK